MQKPRHSVIRTDHLAQSLTQIIEAPELDGNKADVLAYVDNACKTMIEDDPYKACTLIGSHLLPKLAYMKEDAKILNTPQFGAMLYSYWRDGLAAIVEADNENGRHDAFAIMMDAASHAPMRSELKKDILDVMGDYLTKLFDVDAGRAQTLARAAVQFADTYDFETSVRGSKILASFEAASGQPTKPPTALALRTRKLTR